MTPAPEAVVFDHTTLLALGKGAAYLSRLVHLAHHETDQHVYVPALCLVAATAERPAPADHIGGLPGLEIVELGYAAASAVGRLVAGGADWRTAQAMSTARPDPEWPHGRPVITIIPKQYEGSRIKAMPLPS
jgi:hypothetical protein